MKKNTVKRILALAMAACLAAGTMLTGCGKSEAQKPADTQTASADSQTTEAAPAEGGEVTLVIATEPDSFDPFVSVAADTDAILMNVYDGLFTFADDGTMAPDLADSFEVSDDHKVYTFHISEKATFSNGNPVTVDDVVASYKKYAGVKSGFELVEGIEATDEHHVQITLAEPDAAFTSILTAGVAPADESIDLNVTPIGSGPYMITSYVTGSEVVLEKNPYYATNEKRIPTMDKVTVKVNMSDSSVIMNQFLAGDIDMASQMDPANAAAAQAAGAVVNAAPSNTVQILAFNLKEAPFDDVRVRQAVNYAIDKQALVDTLVMGQSAPIVSHMSQAMPAYYTEDLENIYTLDQEKAKALLKDAGYENGLTFTIRVPSNYKRHVDTALMMKDMLAKVGITAEIDQIEWATWLEDVYTNRKFQATVVGMAGKVDPDRILGRYETNYARNMYNYSNPEYDKLIAEGKSEVDQAKRVEIYKQCQQLLIDDAVCVYTMDTSNVQFINPKLGGVKTYPASFINMSSLYWME